MKRIILLLLALVLALMLTACITVPGNPADPGETAIPIVTVAPDPTATVKPDPTSAPAETQTPEVPEHTEAPERRPEDVLDPDGWYYDAESVVLYLYLYGRLPDNFITKKEAQDLGWSGGSVQKYREGAAIGGDSFGNREGNLPKAKGRSYTECDIDTDESSSRGAKRVVFSSDGLYFYTDDHYEHFTELVVTEDWQVEWK